MANKPLSPSLLTPADVFELIEPADPDNIQHAGGQEFLLNWLEGGYTAEQGYRLRQLEDEGKITVIAGPYTPREGNPAVKIQTRIQVH